jgi:hypothetical protein
MHKVRRRIRKEQPLVAGETACARHAVGPSGRWGGRCSPPDAAASPGRAFGAAEPRGTAARPDAVVAPAAVTPSTDAHIGTSNPSSAASHG